MVRHASLLPRDLQGIYDKLGKGMGTLKRQSVREWMEERRYVKAEVPKY